MIAEILLACILFVLLLPFLPLILAGVGAVVRFVFLAALAAVAGLLLLTHLPTVGLAILSIGATVALGYGIAVGLQAIGRAVSWKRSAPHLASAARPAHRSPGAATPPPPAPPGRGSARSAQIAVRRLHQICINWKVKMRHSAGKPTALGQVHQTKRPDHEVGAT